MENLAAIMPAMNCDDITPNNTTDLSHSSRGIMVGTAGDLCVDFAGNGSNVTLVGLLVGIVYPVQVRRIRSTGTTAGQIRVLY